MYVRRERKFQISALFARSSILPSLALDLECCETVTKMQWKLIHSIIIIKFNLVLIIYVKHRNFNYPIYFCMLQMVQHLKYNINVLR